MKKIDWHLRIGVLSVVVTIALAFLAMWWDYMLETRTSSSDRSNLAAKSASNRVSTKPLPEVASVTNDKLHVVIIVDISGSIEDEYTLLKSQVKSLAAGLWKYGFSDSIISVVHTPLIAQGHEQDGERGYAYEHEVPPIGQESPIARTFEVPRQTADILEYMDSFRAHGPTELELVLQVSTRLVSERAAERRKAIVFFFSDGIVNAYRSGNSIFARPTPFVVNPCVEDPNSDPEICLSDPKFLDADGELVFGLSQLNGTADGSDEIGNLKLITDYIESFMVGGYGWAQEDIMQSISTTGTFALLEGPEDRLLRWVPWLYQTGKVKGNYTPLD
ncbi:hypothetical protein SAMN06297129_0435 [Pseudooceanicola antarcticus]|uniref:VWFA domain-containing protein n=1 Tax=Pseudooceanicola antarcticus TaxID=1247613 RepID=A0A285HRR9_9RHOB|nr:vWA domain-containing protein [Pseudooceanicola antarcticus]SNY38412.1 hypothetical protein SAMN06297129_0435 [Pseudooceanicola antarcticus]